MQVRTPTALLLLLSLALSLFTLTYNLAQNRTGLTDPLYADSPHAYFTLKYHTYAEQINTVQFAARIVVVGLEISTLVFYVANRQKQKGTGRPWRFSAAAEYLLLCVLFIWQGVVSGYCVQCQLQIGFKQGSKTGDTVMAVLEGVTLAAILVALITFAYYFTTIHPKNAESLFHSRSDCPQLEDSPNSTRGDGKEQACLEEGARAKQQAINHFKPEFEQYHSPMSRMFQNMSQIAEQEQPAPASNRKPLLEQEQPVEISFKESSKEEPAKKLKIVVPRLKLGQVRKKQTQQDFLYPLNNLQISIIAPHPKSRLSHRSSSSESS